MFLKSCGLCFATLERSFEANPAIFWTASKSDPGIKNFRPKDQQSPKVILLRPLCAEGTSFARKPSKSFFVTFFDGCRANKIKKMTKTHVFMQGSGEVC
jgi:hypothetical protein